MSAAESSSTGTVKKTPLYDVHQDLGANLVDFAGYYMPLRYASETAEHKAVRSGAGLFDLSHMGEIFLSGPQAGDALDHALVGNLSPMKVGKARYTMICAHDGGVLDDLIVYRLADEVWMVVANAANVRVVREALIERAAGFEAVVDDRSDAYALIALQGPDAQGILTGFTDAPLADLKYYAILAGSVTRGGTTPHTPRGEEAASPVGAERVAGIDVLIARTGYTGEDGFELFADAGDAVAIWQELAKVEGVVPCGLASRDSLRLEAGMPLYGNELTAETSPFEAGLGRVVKLDKPGDFVGKAALAAQAQTPPGRRLVGLVAQGRRAPRKGYEVVTSDGTPCGVVTSGAPSPTLGKPIAMAYVDSAVLDTEPAAGLAVDVRGRREPVDVVDLPFYKRQAS
ncbi:glycine cleavage system aminomethyltransferase GcvT [Actinomadura barringtoniae]|uniref:Aminomethyltransferase n=1 Tax=Actinomadura barringtoniae TaxID=1427535 RepID=A0A939T9I6_9ACTN|nr:glycine cleavage system aminomethyltransferase GcvT [Actinomadura barringtoniae]MBO2448015.1 glycine cleavage system aminomethyltransferase GcvT [Actinomadura barringtoniae]